MSEAEALAVDVLSGREVRLDLLGGPVAGSQREVDVVDALRGYATIDHWLERHEPTLADT